MRSSTTLKPINLSTKRNLKPSKVGNKKGYKYKGERIKS